MRKYERLTDSQIRNQIVANGKHVIALHKYTIFLNSGRGLPKNATARDQLKKSNEKQILLLERMNVELKKEQSIRMSE